MIEKIPVTKLTMRVLFKLRKYRRCPMFSVSLERYAHTRSELSKTNLETVAFQRIELLMKALKCSPSPAVHILENNQHLLHCNLSSLNRSATFFAKKLTLNEIMFNPKVLTKRRQRQYEVLSEAGIPNITVAVLMRYENLLNLRVHELKSMNILPEDVDPVNEMLTVLNWPDGKKLLGSSDPSGLSLRQIRRNILVTYLSQRLQCTVQASENRLHAFEILNSYSLLRIRTILNVLHYHADVSLEKLNRMGYLLTQDPEVVKDLLTMSSISSWPIQKIIHEFPLILTSNVDQIKRIDAVFSQYGIEKITKPSHFFAYFFTPKLLEQRLGEVNKIINIKEAENPGFFLKYCLDELGTMKLKKDIESGKLLNEMVACTIRGPYTASRSSIQFLSHNLGKPSRDISRQISVHPLSKHINLGNVKEVYKLVSDHGMRHDQILTSIYIVLYKAGAVANMLKVMEGIPEIQPIDQWINQDLFLDLVIYYIEKEHNFAGFEVFRAPSIESQGKFVENMNMTCENECD